MQSFGFKNVGILKKRLRNVTSIYTAALVYLIRQMIDRNPIIKCRL